MPLGPFDPIPVREKVRRSHVNEMREALTGVLDAYDVALADGFVGTRAEWLQSLVGPSGTPGVGEGGIGVPADGTEADVLGWDGGAPVYIPKRDMSRVIVAANDAPASAKREAWYIGDGSGDHETWQAAIDEAQDILSAGAHRAPTVEILPGAYRFGAGVTAKSAPIIPQVGGTRSVSVYWDGTDGTGTALTKDIAYTGGTSYWELSGIYFRNGASNAAPNVWLDLSQASVDVFCHLEFLQFQGGNQQIKMLGFINAHWNHLRFDAWQDCAIYMNPPASQHYCSFVIDHLTIDNYTQGIGSAGSSFIRYEVEDGATDPGIITLRGGRFEINEPMASPDTLIEVEMSATGGGRPRWKLEDIELAAGGANALSSLIHMDTTNTSNTLDFTAADCKFPTALPLLGGTFSAAQPNPSLPVDCGYFTSGADGANLLGVQRYRTAGGSDNALEFLVGASSFVNLGVRGNGGLNFGTDTLLERKTTNTLGLGSGDIFREASGATGSRPSASTAGAGAVYFDTTLGKPIWSNGTAWVDATGATV